MKASLSLISEKIKNKIKLLHPVEQSMNFTLYVTSTANISSNGLKAALKMSDLKNKAETE